MNAMKSQGLYNLNLDTFIKEILKCAVYLNNAYKVHALISSQFKSLRIPCQDINILIIQCTLRQNQ